MTEFPFLAGQFRFPQYKINLLWQWYKSEISDQEYLLNLPQPLNCKSVPIIVYEISQVSVTD